MDEFKYLEQRRRIDARMNAGGDRNDFSKGG